VLSLFCPTFINSASQADGGILETLWVVLNEAAQSTQTMMLAHRAEVLNAHAADNNWKKMINMGNFFQCFPSVVTDNSHLILCKK